MEQVFPKKVLQCGRAWVIGIKLQMKGNSSPGLSSLFKSHFLFLPRSSSSEVVGSNNCFIHEGNDLFLLVACIPCC